VYLWPLVWLRDARQDQDVRKELQRDLQVPVRELVMSQ
jgi:hypothetical protein